MAQTKKKELVGDKTSRVRVFKGGHNTPPVSGPVDRPSHMKGPKTSKRPRISNSVKEDALALLEAGHTLSNVADRFGISKATASRMRKSSRNATTLKEGSSRSKGDVPTFSELSLNNKYSPHEGNNSNSWVDKIYSNMFSVIVITLSVASMATLLVTDGVPNALDFIVLVTQIILTGLLIGKVFR